MAEGNPYPVVTWTINGQPIPDNSRYNQQDVGTLEINRLRADEGGLYECTATNRLGSRTVSVNLTVLGTFLLEQTSVADLEFARRGGTNLHEKISTLE